MRTLVSLQCILQRPASQQGCNQLGTGLGCTHTSSEC